MLVFLLKSFRRFAYSKSLKLVIKDSKKISVGIPNNCFGVYCGADDNIIALDLPVGDKVKREAVGQIVR